MIEKIVIHCAATKNGRPLGNERQSAAEIIDKWHASRGFKRQAWRTARFNPHLKHIGYHFVIDCDGRCETAREIGEMGAHVRGHNKNSIGICLIGTDKFTRIQWQNLRQIVLQLKNRYPRAKVLGHRDLSPDRNGDGKITPEEWTKLCPGFSVDQWLASACQPLGAHLCQREDT